MLILENKNTENDGKTFQRPVFCKQPDLLS